MIGGLAQSAYSKRTIVVLDSVHNKTNTSQLISLGVSSEKIVVWSNNGIEYLYPVGFLAKKFMCSVEEIPKNISGGDNVEMNGISIRKRDLASEAATYLTDSTTYPKEFDIKLFRTIRRVLGMD